MRKLFLTMALGLALGAGLPAVQNEAVAQPLVQAHYTGYAHGHGYRRPPPPPPRHWQHSHGYRHRYAPPPRHDHGRHGPYSHRHYGR